MLKSTKGITLIALIITIIVLLILAGITISLVVGDNGILSKSTQAKVASIIEQEKEQMNLAYSAAFTKKLGDTVTREELQDELDKIVGEGKTTVTGNITFRVKFSDTNNEYSISQNGKVDEYEKAELTSVYTAVCQNGYLVFSNNEADINNYLAENNTSLSDGYEISDIKDDVYYQDATSGNSNRPIWEYDFNIEYAVFLNTVVPKSTAYWFSGLGSLKKIENISKLNTCNVISMSCMFMNLYALTELDVSGFDTSSCTDMSYMFSIYDGENGVTTVDLTGFDTSNVTNMQGMFNGWGSLTNLDLSNFDTSKVTNMNTMFACCDLTNLDLSSFDTSNVTDMSNMFYECNSLINLNLSSFNTSKVTDMSNMFHYCKFETIDLSSFDTSNVTDMTKMFAGCNRLATIYVGPNWIISNVENSYYMFDGCISLIGGNGTTYEISITNLQQDKTYARVDGGSSNPGYLTLKTN